MDARLVHALIERDWPNFIDQVKRLHLSEPKRDGIRIDIECKPTGTDDRFRAVLICEDYDAQAPVLDFADIDNPALLGAPYWPKMAKAPMNAVQWKGRHLPIICTPGTLGYHIHQSHCGETHARDTWRLPAVASLLHRLLTSMGPYAGRGV